MTRMIKMEEFQSNELILVNQLKENEIHYKNSNKDQILSKLKEPHHVYRNQTIDTSRFSDLIKNNSLEAEIHNAKIIFESLKTHDGELKRYVAARTEIWVYLAHTCLFDFMTNIEKKTKNKEIPIDNIGKYFLSLDGGKIDKSSRGSWRNHYLFKLYWSYRFALKCKGLKIEDSLAWILKNVDLASGFLERTGISHIDSAFGGIVRFSIKNIPDDWRNKGYDFYDKVGDISNDPEEKLDKRTFYRHFAKLINARGGFINFELLSEDEMVEECEQVFEKMINNLIKKTN